MRRSIREWLGVLSVALLTLPVQAQPGGGGRGQGGFFREAFSLPISVRDLKEITRELNLSEDQQQVAGMLYEGFRSRFEEQSTELRSALERIREERDQQQMREMGARMREFREARRTMQEGFLEDLRAILTPAQEERWGGVERALRRSQTLGRGFMRAERVDLIRVTRELLGEEGDPPAELAQVLDRYEVELDRELVNRNRVTEEAWEKAREVIRNGNREEIDRLMGEVRQASLRLRDLNRRFERMIASALPEDMRAGFEQSVRERTFPDVYRETYATRALAAAAGFADLDENQQTGIEALRTSYERRLAELNRNLIQAIERWEEEASVRELMPWARRRGGDDRPGADLRRERRSLGETTVDKLKAILSEEQIARLPKAEEEGGRRGLGRGRDQGIF